MPERALTSFTGGNDDIGHRQYYIGHKQSRFRPHVDIGHTISSTEPEAETKEGDRGDRPPQKVRWMGRKYSCSRLKAQSRHTNRIGRTSETSSQKPTQSMCVKRPQSSHRIDLFSHSFEHITQCKLIRLQLYAIMYDQLRQNSVFCCPYITLVIRLCYTVSMSLMSEYRSGVASRQECGWLS